MPVHRSPRDARDESLLAAYARNPDPNRLDHLVRRFRPLARHIAREHAGLGESSDDLRQVADLGLLLAIKRYDVERGTRFAAFAAPTIRGELRRHLRDRCWAVHVPRPLRELDERARRTRAELERAGRPSRDVDLARALQVTPRALDEARAASHAFSAEEITTPDGEERFADDAHELGYARVDAQDLVLRELQRLRERERVIVGRRLEGHRQVDIAREVGVSQVHVSRLLAAVRSQLRRAGSDEPS